MAEKFRGGLNAGGSHRGSGTSWLRKASLFFGGLSTVSVGIVMLIVVALLGLFGSLIAIQVTEQNPSLNVTPSKTATKQVPREYLAVYEEVANQDEVPWIVLAGLGEELTKQGTRSPYDSIVRKTTYPNVSPPIGGGKNQGSGPMMLDPKAASALGKQKAQNVEASINYIGEQLSQDAQQLANQQGLDYANELEQPLSQTAGFWVQAVSELPIEQTRLSCAPPSGITDVPSEIEWIWSCELTGKTIYLEAGPGVVVPTSEAPNELVAEALEVSYALLEMGGDELQHKE